MTIRIYSKDGCKKCEAAKGKLTRMGFPYEEHDLEYHVEPHDGWRDDGSVAVMAAHSMMDTLPLIQLDEDFHDYPSAMRKLKSLRHEAKAS